MSKKLMILGAGSGQLPAIKQAVACGYHVITVDYLPDNIGHKFSHQFINCSTVDSQAVLEAAKREKIDGILTFASDVATVSVGYTAEKLGLPGSSTFVAQTMSNKAQFRAFQKEQALNAPGFVTGYEMDAVWEKITRLTPPVVFKPVDTSGSRGIVQTNTFNRADCHHLFAYAKQYSRSGLVCIEEYIEGEDVSGDGFLLNGKLHTVITQKHKNAFMPVGHSLPTHLSLTDQQRIIREIETNCSALGYASGPIDFDVRVSAEKVVVLEMSPRLGGNGIPAIIERATGVSLINATIQYVLGETPQIPTEFTISRPCGSWVFGSSQAGRLKHIATQTQIQSAVPEVFEFFTNYTIGEEISRFIHSGNSVGYALFDCPPETTYHNLVRQIETAMGLVVTPSGLATE